MSGEMSAGVRTSDAEREQVARVLRAAVGEGMLTLEEGDERLAATYAARFRCRWNNMPTWFESSGWPRTG